MLPELFSIGPVTIHSYGFMIALGVIIALSLGEHWAKKRELAEDGFVTTLGVISIVGGFIGAKILFWITILPDIIREPSIILQEVMNGFVVYGGLIGGLLTAYVYCRIKKVDYWKLFDLAVPLIALAQCFGRIGCFLAGCCYGQETDSVCGVAFSISDFAPNGIRLFPIQLVASGLNLLNFLFLAWLWKSNKLRKGMVGAAYVITYSAGRFVLEYFRGDLERGSVGVLSTSQFISIFTIVIGIILMILLRKKTER
ncbi:MAG: prolipoprotein diacylglyceryl transferase [Lachnospiraceae bacterium]|nr:prolipoprotein diacylglyceryl transferase [Lachnospiraceae bacterium]